MMKREILSVAFKILGVISIMYTIVLIPNIGMAIGSMILPSKDNYESYLKIWQIVMSLSWPVCSLVIGLMLLKWGDKLATRLAREDREISLKTSGDWEKNIFITSLKVIGVLFLLRGIPDFIKAIGEIVQKWFIYYFGIYRTIFVLFAACVSIIIGFYLLTGGNALVNLAFRQPKKIDEEKNKKDIQK